MDHTFVLALVSSFYLTRAARQKVAHASDVLNTEHVEVEPLVVTAEELDEKVGLIGCPVLAALYRRGHLKPDRHGRVSAYNLGQALMETGATFPVASFQSVGIAGYSYGDLHQNVRSVGVMSFFSSRYVNIFSMNVADSCSTAGNRTSGGFPCNANTQFIQHGYSTTLRDTRFDQTDPGRRQRFEHWLGQELVYRPELDTEPVLLLSGMMRMLARARNGAEQHSIGSMLSGDFNGEYSLTQDLKWEGSNLQKYHPSVDNPKKYRALSAWQPVFAWCGWWSAFSRRKGEHAGTRYFTRTDLEAFFLHGDFPEDWEARKWGFVEDFQVTAHLKGRGAGDEWIDLVQEMKSRTGFGHGVDEMKGNMEMLTKLMFSLAIQQDDIHHTWP